MIQGSREAKKYIRSYGRRKGRGLTSDDADKLSGSEYIISSIVLPQTKNLWLEIGSGSGENLVYQAENNPDVMLIGCEPYFNGVATTIKKAKAKKLKNIRLYAGDARELLESLPDNSIEKVFILYPDPWPKKRHNKRRIINAETLNILARVMKNGSTLRTATDHPDYAEWILLRVFENQRFKWTAKSSQDFNNPPLDYTPTKYEQKQLAGKPVYLEFIKND